MPTSLTSDHEPPNAPFVLAVILLAALALRLPGLTQSVWTDELYTSGLFVGDFVTLLKTLYSDIHPPAYFLLIHAWGRLFGDGEVALRLPPLLCSLGSIVLVYRIGATAFGGITGLVAAALLAVSPVHIWYSQEARPYAANVFLFVLCTYAFVRLHGGGRRGWYTVWLLALFGIVFTHYYMACFPVLFAAFVVRHREAGRRRVIAGCAAALLVLALYMGAKIYFSEVPTAKGYLRAFGPTEAWRLFTVWFTTGNSLVPLDVAEGESVRLGWLCTPLALVTVQAAAVLAVVIGITRFAPDTPERPTAWFLAAAMLTLPAFLAVLPWIGMQRTFIERSALPSLPLFVIFVAAGITAARPGLGRRVALATSGVLCAAVLAAFYANRWRAWTVYKPHPDWRGAAAFLAADIAPAEDRVPLYTDFPSPTPLTYYDRRFQEVKNFVRSAGRIERLVTKTTEVFGRQGFPGGTLRGFIEARLAEHRARLDQDERDMRIPIHHLRPDTRITARRFYVLYFGRVSDLVAELLRRPGYRVTQRHTVRALTVCKIERD